MQYIGVIPARYNSRRLHAKALYQLCGKPMFWHVYTRAQQCPLFSAVYLATDDTRISSIAEEYNIPYIMTSTEHMSGTDRIFEAVQRLNIDEDSVIANIQGDEPLLHPNMLTELLSPFEQDASIQVTTLCTPLENAHLADPARVKVIANIYGDALYFSRSIIPFNRNNIPLTYKAHIGLYAFRYHALKQFVQYPPCLLEQSESLEQLRFLYNGIPIRLVETLHQVHSVDEAKDIPYVESVLENEREIYNY